MNTKTNIIKLAAFAANTNARVAHKAADQLDGAVKRSILNSEMRKDVQAIRSVTDRLDDLQFALSEFVNHPALDDLDRPAALLAFDQVFVCPVLESCRALEKSLQNAQGQTLPQAEEALEKMEEVYAQLLNTREVQGDEGLEEAIQHLAAAKADHATA